MCGIVVAIVGRTRAVNEVLAFYSLGGISSLVAFLFHDNGTVLGERVHRAWRVLDLHPGFRSVQVDVPRILVPEATI